MPKKQFYISTKNNKVYDITDRKVRKRITGESSTTFFIFFRTTAAIFVTGPVFISKAR